MSLDCDLQVVREHTELLYLKHHLPIGIFPFFPMSRDFHTKCMTDVKHVPARGECDQISVYAPIAIKGDLRRLFCVIEAVVTKFRAPRLHKFNAD